MLSTAALEGAQMRILGFTLAAAAIAASVSEELTFYKYVRFQHFCAEFNTKRLIILPIWLLDFELDFTDRVIISISE